MIRRFLQRLRPLAATIATLGLVAMPPVRMVAMGSGQPCAPAAAPSHAQHDAPVGGDHHAPANATDCCIVCLGCAGHAVHASRVSATATEAATRLRPVVHHPAEGRRPSPAPHALPFSLPPPASIA